MSAPHRLLFHGRHMTLILKRAGSSRPGNISWGDNDYDVLDEARACVGRIFKSPHSPSDRNWMWTIIARAQPPSVHSRGYSETREQAMTDFKVQWRA
jgi:hypothetical protein